MTRLILVLIISLFATSAAYAQEGQAEATILVRLTQIQEELRQLKGKLEEAQYQNSKLSERLDKISQDNEFRFNQLEKGGVSPDGTSATVRIGDDPTPDPAPVVSPTPSPVRPPVAEVSAPASMQGSPAAGEGKVLGQVKLNGDQPVGIAQPVKPAVEKPAMPKAPAPAAVKVPGPKEQFDTAFNLLKEKKYSEAIAALEEFAKKYPKDAQAGSAIYWAGEAYYVQGDYTEAAKKFIESYKRYPKGAKAPDSLLKLSMALAGLDKKKEACTTLAELNEKFPKASAAVKKKAASEKKKYGCK